MSCRLITRFFFEQERPETGGFLAFFRASGIAVRETAVPAMQGTAVPSLQGLLSTLDSLVRPSFYANGSTQKEVSATLLAVFNHDRLPQSRCHSLK